MANTVKVTVNLPPDTVDTIGDLASKQNITKTEAVRGALETQAYLAREVKRGSRILVQDKKGNMKEIVLPRFK